VSEFLAMGGYGAFVWSVYLLAAIVMGGLALASWRRQRQLVRITEALRAARRDEDSPDTAEGG